MIYNELSFCIKQIRLSQGRYAHFGANGLPKTREKDKFENTVYISKVAAQTRRLICQTKIDISDEDLNIG